MANDSGSADMFSSLGGSLMKDLLLDDDEGDLNWTLDQLEKELADFDMAATGESETSTTTRAPPGLSAAELVVSHADTQQQKSVGQQQQPAAATTDDSWLSNFAGSLADDFLAADTARRQQNSKAAQSNTPNAPPPLLESSMGDYDVTETVVVGKLPPGFGVVPPPAKGVPPPSGSGVSLPTPPPQQQQQQPPSMGIPPGLGQVPPPLAMGQVPPGVALPPQQAPPVGAGQQAAPRPMPPPGATLGPVPPPGVTMIPPPPPQHPQQQQRMPHPPPGVTMMPPQQQHRQQPPQQQQHLPAPIVGVPMMPPGMQPMAQPPPPRPPAQQHVMGLFARTHPGAPPVPAHAIKASLMSTRDVLFVLHTLMRPLLQQNTSTDYYHLHYLRLLPRRRIKQQSGGSNDDNSSKNGGDSSSGGTNKIISKDQLSKDWMVQRKNLGRVVGTDVNRPRALLTVSSDNISEEKEESKTEKKEEQKEEAEVPSAKARASLWRARLRVDRAYMAMLDLEEVLLLQQQQQHHVMRMQHSSKDELLKNLLSSIGLISPQNINKMAIYEILQLSKGRTLLARTLERGLIPPPVVDQALPVWLAILLQLPASSSSVLRMPQQSTPSSSSLADKNNDVDSLENYRVWRAMTVAASSLPLSPNCTLQCLRETNDGVLKQPCRMELVHVILRKGQALAGQNAEFRKEWDKAQEQHLTWLGGASK